MPEIWLGYGTTNVVLDIKQENLSHFVPTPQIFSKEYLYNFLSNINFLKKTLFFPLSGSKAVIKILSLLVDISNSNPDFEIEIGTYPIIFQLIRTYFSNYKKPITQIEKQDLLDKIKKYNQVVFISRVYHDPLFGFHGTPSILMRNSGNNLMNQLFSSPSMEFPKPGKVGEPLKMALEFCNKLNIYSIDLVSYNSGIVGIHYGNTISSFQESISSLNSMVTLYDGENRAIIASSGYEYENHLTLSNSLNFLWNIVPLLRKNGSAVLLSESSGGIGEGALKMYIEGRLSMNEIKKGNYINGLEHLLFLKCLREEYNLGIVSSLPFYYTRKKLGLTSFNNVKEVLENFLSKYGRNSKVIVCPDPDSTLLRK